MNYKLNSYLSILAIACAVAVPLLSATAHELPVQAALSAPASWDIKYASDGFEYGITNPSNNTSNNYLSYPEYTRTADGIYYNYNSEIDFNDTSIIPQGLVINHTFNRSNTSWMLGVGSTYQAVDTKIGSNTSVGSISNKVYLKFDNQTNKDYALILDLSSTSNYSLAYNFKYNSTTGNFIHAPSTTALLYLYLPSLTLFELLVPNTNGTAYFDAWYLKDLGVSASYDLGYDAGYQVGEDDGYEDGLANNPNLLINATESLIGMFVNFTFILFSLELFGVSILTVVGVLFGIVAIVWILKTIRG
jgi:hypothetical protein